MDDHSPSLTEDDDAILIADDCRFKVSRSILANNSLYFAAALHSSLIEGQTGRFVFHNMTAIQLDMFARCAKSNFSSWPSRVKTMTAQPPHPCFCSPRVEFDDILGLASMADYLILPALAELCASRLTNLFEELFTTQSISRHRSHDVCILRDFLFLWTNHDRGYPAAVTEVLYAFATKYPLFVLKPSPSNCSNDPNESCIVDLVTSLLSSDSICLPDEDRVFHLAVEWIQAFCPDGKDDVNRSVFEAFLDCVRPGLLSNSCQKRMHEIWSRCFPDYKWQGCMDLQQFSAHIESQPSDGGPFSEIMNPHLRISTYTSEIFKPRASVPCVLSLAPNQNRTALSLSLLNLDKNKIHTQQLSDLFLNQVFNHAFNLSDLDTRMFICHPTAQPDGHLIAVLGFDSTNAQLNGFLWCLATRQAKWFPTLNLTQPSHHNPLFKSLFPSSTFRSRGLGVSSLGRNILVYFVTVALKSLQLHVFQFDYTTWVWSSFPETALQTHPSYSSILFTPIEHLDLLPLDGWLYFSLELACHSSGRDSHMIGRHNLHRATHLRSYFYRFRPMANAKQIELDELPTAPFLLRIYRLLALKEHVCPHKPLNNYLFAFGTCCRDENANQYCLDMTTRIWIRWNQPDDPEITSPIRSTLCPELLGFRGVVSVSALDKPLLSESQSSHSSALTNVQQNNNCTSDGCGKDFVNPNPELILIGHPGYATQDYQPSSSGIWFYRPMVAQSWEPVSSDRIQPFRSNHPSGPMPCDNETNVSEVLSNQIAVRVNWEALTGNPSDLFNFINRCPVSYLSDPQDQLSSTFNCATAADSD